MGLVVGWPRRRMGQQMVGEVARGLSLFGGASSEVRRCICSVVGVAQQPSCSLCVFLPTVCLSVCLSLTFSAVHGSDHVGGSPSICLPVCLPACLSGATVHGMYGTPETGTWTGTCTEYVYGVRTAYGDPGARRPAPPVGIARRRLARVARTHVPP